MLGSAVGLCRVGRKGQGAVPEARLLAVSRRKGQGGVAGRTLAPNPLPFEALQNFVRTTNRNMPPYREEILSNDDLADIYAYLQSIPKGPDPKSIPLLNQ